MAPVLVDVPFPSGASFKGVVRQFIGVGTLNVKTARGEVKAESTDIIITLEDDPNDPENEDNIRDIKEGKTTMVFPEDLFYALWPSAGVVQKMRDSDRVIFDAMGNAVFVGADGMVTEEDGTAVEDTPENRVRFPGAFYEPQVLNGPRVQKWPFPPRPTQLPADQGALNRALAIKSGLLEQPEIDNSLPTTPPPYADNTLPGQAAPKDDFLS